MSNADATIRAGVPRLRIARRRSTELLHRLNRLGMYTLMLAYVPLVLGTVTAAVYIGYQASVWAWRMLAQGTYLERRLAIAVGLLDLALLSLCGFLLLGLLPLFFRDVTPRPQGELLDLRRHARLGELLQRVAKRLGTRPPDACLLTPWTNAWIGDLNIVNHDGSVTRNVRALALGAGLIVHTQVNELVTIICHEMAHAATGDTRIYRVAHRFHCSMALQIAQQCDAPEGEARSWTSFAMYLLLAAYYHTFALLYFADCRFRELRADRIAAEICGPQHVRNALVKIHLVDYLPELSLEQLWLDYCQNERDVQNLYAEHRRRWTDLAPERRAHAENEMFMRTGCLWSTHPPLAERIRNLADVTTRELSGNEPAARLFRQWDALEHQITDRIITAGRAAHDAYIDALDTWLRRAR